MSFETWLTTTDIPEHYIGISHVRDAFEAGRAEAEAQIAALKDSHTEVEMQLVALQSERDALAQEYVAPDAELIAILSPLSVKNVPTSVIELTEKAMAQIAALQAERDALREALKSLESSGDDGACPSCGHHPMNGHTAQCVFKAVLSTPASGEPARKVK